MLASRRNARTIARLAIAFLAVLTIAPDAPAGPISDMIARHRQARSMKLPPADKPRAIRPIKDPNARTAGLTGRFKQRFSLKKGQSTGSTKDQGVIQTSR